MTPARYERVRDVFLAVRVRPAADQLGALDLLCAGDAELRAEVESLLRTEADSNSFLQTPVLGAAFVIGSPELVAQAGSHGAGEPRPLAAGRAAPQPAFVGEYEILDLLGEGGMGVVCRARQKNPTRIVALKLIRPGFESAEARRRFQHEAEVLAYLQHAGIAQVFEAGVVELGGSLRPYFAMELVQGQPITEFVAARGWTLRQRLELFATVCDAVQHAHQKGVIHRDIKPSNILVTAEAQPKVLDFGVARVIGADRWGATLETQAGQILGTLAYMSPEQIAGDVAGLDTRTDVYALGATLYELLTGHTPLDLSGKSLVEVTQLITGPEPARCRTYNRQIPVDVDVIVSTALARDKSHRCASASDLAGDIRRFLADQPIMARPPSTLYQLQKLARRHRAVVAGAAVALLALVWGLVQTTAERNRAVRAEQVAQQQRAEAERQAAIATAVNDFLNNDLLGAANPARSQDRQVTVRQVLDRASASIGDRFASDPLIEAAVRLSIGDAYTSLGLYPPAIGHLKRAVELFESAAGPDSVRTAVALDRLGLARFYAGDYAEAERLFGRVIAIRRAALGPGHLRTLEAQNHLCLLYGQQGRLAEQEQLLLATLADARRALGNENLSTMLLVGNLADLYSDQGRYAEAEPLFLEALAADRRLRGPQHPDTLTTMLNLATLYWRTGRLEEALALAEPVVAGRRQLFGDEHQKTLIAQTTLGIIYNKMGCLVEAEELFRQTAEAKARTLGPDHPNTLVSLNNLAGVLARTGRNDEAESLYQQVVDARLRVLGPNHPQTIKALESLSEVRGGRARVTEPGP